MIQASEPVRAADLFCGAGGTSHGLARACTRLGVPVKLWAVNHWQKAVSSHRRNHPWATHRCAQIDQLDPMKVVPDGKLDFIVAGIECIYHSRARGGKPVCDQARASAWSVLTWAEKLRAKDILIENVPEFMGWGPVDSKGRRIKERAGETFHAFVQGLESLNYRVEHRIITCADYGDPTTRRRFFLRARLDRRPIEWPSQTHSENGEEDGLVPWRSARSIIDWSDLGTSIFTRKRDGKRPLAPRTIERIKAGIRKFCGDFATPFLVMFYGTNDARSLDRPVPTVTAQGEHIGLASPMYTAPGSQAGQPLVLPFGSLRSGQGHAIAPFIVPHFGERKGQAPRTHSLDAPAPTVTATKGAGSLCTPFLMPYYRTGRCHSVEEPVQTVTTRERFALVTPDHYALDIYFRMLSPLELARAQGFPDDFEFVGNKGDVVRQIGNAVPVGTAEHLCFSTLDRSNQPGYTN